MATDVRFRLRLLAVIVSLVALMLGGVLLGMELTVGRTLRQQLARSVEASAAAVGDRLRADLDRLAREAQLVAQEPRLRALVATAGADRASVADTLEELQATTRWDVAALIAADGTIVAARGTDGLTPLAIERGYTTIDGRLYRVALAPIRFGDTLAGRVLAGQQISDSLLADTTRSTGNVVAVAVGGSVLAASPPLDGDRHPRQLRTTAGEVVVGGERFLSAPIELGEDLSAVLMRNADEALGPYQRTRKLVWLMGAIALYGGAILAWLMARRLTRPVTTLQEHVQRVELDLQQLMDVIPDAVAVLVEGRFVYANHAMLRMLACGEACDVVGLPVLEVVDPADRRAFAQLVGAAPARSDGCIRFLSAAGGPIETEVAALPVEFGGTHAIATVAHDVRLRKAYQGRLLADRAAAKELEVARSIQREMVPTEALFERAGVRFAGHFEPARECGGDWWTFHEFAGGKLLLLIGDVTGHGIPAAMITVAAKAASDVVCSVHGGDVPVERVLQVMNLAISGAARQRFVMTCFAAVFDTQRRTVTFANAGHNFPLVCTTSGALCGLVSRGEPLGASENSRYPASTATLHSGDLLLFYTDGLTESTRAGGESFGSRRLREAVRESAALDPTRARDRVLGSLRGFLEAEPLRDDVTFVAVKVS